MVDWPRRKRRVFMVPNLRQDIAREAAKSECQQASALTCEVIAMPSFWDVIVVHCTGSPGQSPAVFIGGSIQGTEMATALSKARSLAPRAAPVDADNTDEGLTILHQGHLMAAQCAAFAGRRAPERSGHCRWLAHACPSATRVCPEQLR
jgi:hypothetical protein